MQRPTVTTDRPLHVLLCWISTPAKELSGSRFQSSREHGKPKIQPCNACVSSSMALCVWPCNCYGPHSDHQPHLPWDLDLYARLARADAVGVYRADQLVGVHLELQAAVRSACLHERPQSSTGFDWQEEHGFGASSRAFHPMERTVQEPFGGPFSRLLLLWRSRRGRSGRGRATNDTDS
jgi:hypothetical protein